MGNTDEYAKAIQSLLAKQMREEYLRASEYEKFKKYNAKVADKQDWDGDEFKRCLKQLENEKEDTIDLSGFRPKGNPLTYPDKYVNIISNPSGRDTWADMFVKQQLLNPNKFDPPKKIEPFPDDTGYIPIYTPYLCTKDFIDFLFPNQFCVRCEAGTFADNDCWLLQICRGHKNLVDTDTGLMLISQHNSFKDVSRSRTNVLDSDQFIFPKNKLVVEQFLYIIKSIQCEPTQLTSYELNDTQSHIDVIFNYKVDADLSRMRKTCYISSMKHNQKDTP